jgi:hypothetical protein
MRRGSGPGEARRARPKNVTVDTATAGGVSVLNIFLHSALLYLASCFIST